MNILPLIIWLQLLLAGTAIASETPISKIQKVDQLFSSNGPTVEVLQEFERVILEVSNDTSAKPYLSQLYFKKALIELNLGKENLAVEDLKTVVTLDPLQRPAKNKLIEILIARGDFNSLEPYLDPQDDRSILSTMDNWNHSMSLARSHYSSNEYQSCLDQLNDVLTVTPKNYESGELHYLSALELYKQDPLKKFDYLDESLPLHKIIISDLTKLISIRPWTNLNFYSQVSQFILFTENQFENARNIISNCVRFDNEFKPCTELSKFYSKFQDFLKLLEQYSIITGHYYAISEKVDLAEELINPTLDFKYIYDFLFVEELKVSRLEKKQLSSSIRTNYDYLRYRASKFLIELVGNDKYLSNLIFIQDLSKLACESHIRIEGKLSPHCKSLDDSFFPKYIPEIDKLLKQKKFNEAKRILQKFNPNVKQTKMFTDRFSKIKQFLNQQQQKQQRSYQQQFHNQQRQQQRQYRQQHQQQQQPRTPAKDYYKVLGVSKNANEREIKSAYRKMTLKYHPDKYKGDDLTPEQIEHKMQEINQAYEVLSTPELKERYDRGDDPNDNTSGGGGGGGGGGGFHGFNQGFNFNGFASGGDPFSQFFGSQGRRSGGFKFKFG